MFPLDHEVWNRFLDKYGSLYSTFVYDARVGKKTWVHPSWEEKYKQDAQVLSQLRIDAIGFRDKIIDIIEVKPRFSAAAIGQVLVYKDRFIKDFKPKKPVRALVVAGSVNPNLQPLLEKLKVVYLQV